jgi:hypothetical protein
MVWVRQEVSLDQYSEAEQHPIEVMTFGPARVGCWRCHLVKLGRQFELEGHHDLEQMRRQIWGRRRRLLFHDVWQDLA